MAGAVLFAGCKPEVAGGPDGRIIGVGARAREAAGRGAEVVRLRGTTWPGLIDAHIHLEGLAERHLTLDLTAARSLDDALARVKQWAAHLPNGHSAWVSSAALKQAGIERGTDDPPGGVIDRDDQGEPSGILRETAMELAAAIVPRATDSDLDAAMARALAAIARLGLTSVHSMDSASGFGSFQRLHARGKLPLRITYNLPLADLHHAERIGVRSGWGDPWLRIWGVKAFLDGSLGSRTAEMLDGSGTVRLPQKDLLEMVERCARAQLNVCLHAIGDGAVRRALDALAPHRNAWRFWRPRIEHAQCVDPKDLRHFARAGAIASMQPIHAVADRELADEYWPTVSRHAYAWGALERAGARLVFGSDAPVETADPLLGIDAAAGWRRRAKWHPDLAVSRVSALRAYTSDAAYAVGMERDLGSLREGMLCDLTVVDDGRVVATVVGGRVSWLRKPSAASPRSAAGAR